MFIIYGGTTVITHNCSSLPVFPYKFGIKIYFPNIFDHKCNLHNLHFTISKNKS